MASSGRATARRRVIGSLLMLAGVLLLAAWGARAYILMLRWAGTPLLFLHTVITLISLAAATWLFRLGLRTRRQPGRAGDARWVALTGLWLAGIGLNRLNLVLTQPDPDPRAHLHLSVLFIVIGVTLLGMAWFWKRTVLA